MNECSVCTLHVKEHVPACGYLIKDANKVIWTCDRPAGHTGPHIACRRPPLPNKINHCVVIEFTKDQEYLTFQFERK